MQLFDVAGRPDNLSAKCLKPALVALALALVYAGAALWMHASFAPDARRVDGPDVAGARIKLYPPFGRQGLSPTSFAFGIEHSSAFPDEADTAQEPTRSTLKLYEDGRELGPAHSDLSAIALHGRGRYAHVKQTTAVIFFSASDNTDPNTNGRSYWLVRPDQPRGN